MLLQGSPSNAVQKFITWKVNDITDRKRVEISDFDWETFEQLKGKINVDIIDIENQQNKNIQRKAIIGFLFAFFIYFFVFLYAVQVMKGVIEERQIELWKLLYHLYQVFSS